VSAPAQDILIPAGEARAFIVRRRQTFRLIQVQGEQVADAIFFNANDYRETYHAAHTVYMACLEGTGNIKRVTHLYSKPPRENVMLTVTADPVGVHFAYIGNRCSRLIYRTRDKVEAPPHRTCQDNLAGAIAPYGLTPDDVPDVFNIWMNVDIDSNGRFVVKPPTVKKDDFIEFRAEMDCLVAVSSCPSDIAPVNNFRIKPLRVEIRSIA
jgi:uncharacterized protein YcgI (DUF1989 family)